MSNWIRESNLIEDVDSVSEDKRCLRAWNKLQHKKVGLDTILWLHKTLMWNLDRPIAGKGRWKLLVNVRVGGHVCPHYIEVYEKLITWIFNFPLQKTEEEIRRYHVEFEKIHPFVDGNGRVGRMLMNWQRKLAGLEPLCIKADERHAYYEWFK